MYLDIETRPLPPEQRMFCKPTKKNMKWGNLKDPVKKQEKYLATVKQWKENGNALDPAQSEVCAIGAMSDPMGELTLDYAIDGRTEKDLLTDFWTDYKKTKPILIGHYIAQFDLPFMCKRSRLLDVDFPTYLEAVAGQYNPNGEVIFDTRIGWCGKAEHISLVKLAGACGFTCKDTECSGADFWKFLRDGKIEECNKYLTGDVMAVKAIYEKLFA